MWASVLLKTISVFCVFLVSDFNVWVVIGIPMYCINRHSNSVSYSLPIITTRIKNDTETYIGKKEVLEYSETA